METSSKLHRDTSGAGMSNVLYFVRTVAAFVVGLFVAFVLVVGVELLSNVLHPLPSDFAGEPEQVCLHVANCPAWVLAIVVVAWGLIASIATWIAQRIGNVFSATLLGLLLFAAVGLNIWMLPYPIWFEVVIMLVVPIACTWGARLGAHNQKS